MIPTTILTSSEWIFAVSIIALWISLSLKRVVINPFAFFFFAFFYYTLLFLTPCLLLILSYSYTKERSLKDHCHSCKCSKITLTFSSFNICLVNALVSVWIGISRLTNVVFVVGVGNLIVDTSPVWRRFLLDIAGANGVDILINYRATSTDQFDSISKMIAVVGV